MNVATGEGPEGGVLCPDGSRIWPEVVLVGRSPSRVGEITKRYDLPDRSTDLSGVLARDDVQVYFDAQLTRAREHAVLAAVAAGKHVYTEKPLAETRQTALPPLGPA